MRSLERGLFSAPWLAPDAYPNLDGRSQTDIVAFHQAIPPGVMARHGTSPLVPVKVADLIGVRERRYLDATGLARHRDIGDLMRYAAMNQTTDLNGRLSGVRSARGAGSRQSKTRGRATATSSSMPYRSTCTR